MLYKLDCVYDNPMYEGFAFARPSLMFRALFSWDRITVGRSWTKERIADIWKPPRVVGRVRSFNDNPGVSLGIPAFSRRAVDALRDMLEPNGELLPLRSHVGEYYAYNITTVADILDQKRTKIKWLSKTRTLDQIFQIERFECVPEKLEDLSIFHIVESTAAYVTQSFVDRVRIHNLNGFHFAKLWPLPKGAHWLEEDWKSRKKEKKVRVGRGKRYVKANTVFLLLPISTERPDKAEKRRLNQIMDQIDAILYDPDAGPDAQVIGNLEGHDVVKGALRLALSCPNADILVEKLQPWLRKRPWNGDIKVVKRYVKLENMNLWD